MSLLPHFRAVFHSRRVRHAALSIMALVVPASSSYTQARESCPRFARVPGYGACINFAGASCSFCGYRCNDETVVRWNVCGG
jgi:hypothetical protein